MRYLFVPHESFERPYRQREHYLIEKLSEKHEIHVISWTYRSVLSPENATDVLDLGAAIRGLSEWKEQDSYTRHHIRRAVYPPIVTTPINQAFFRNALRKIVKEEDIDVLILGPSSGLLGFPRHDTGVPMIFDYSDHIQRRSILAKYAAMSSAVTCCSRSLVRDASPYSPTCYYLPNGLDIAKFSGARAEDLRRDLGIDGGTCVIGLIGATASEDLYYMRASRLLSRYVGDFAFLVVGGGQRAKEIQEYSERRGLRSIFTGWVPYERIEGYFAATDVGIYPGEHTPFFEYAMPIKILEFTAAKRPVASTDLEGVRSLEFPNVFLSEPNEESFAKAIGKAYDYRGSYPDVSEFDWSRLASQLNRIAESVLAD